VDAARRAAQREADDKVLGVVGLDRSLLAEPGTPAEPGSGSPVGDAGQE
jgi:hypothetical protein